MRYPTAAKVERHLAYRAHVAARVARLSTLLAAWDEWDVDQLLPPAERRLTRLPEGGREALGVLYHALRSELDELDELGAPEEREVVAVPAAVGAAGSAPGSTGG